jgi:hypothetical protein
MNTPVELAIVYVRRFADLAERLAKQNIVVRKLDCDWQSFGSFIVDASDGEEEAKRALAVQRGAFAEPGPDVYRLSWDGKDRLLSAGSMRTTASTMIGPRRALDSRPCDSYEDAIRVAYEWLTDRLGSSRRC